MEQAGQAILFERRDRVALMTFNRPTVINAINTEIRTGIMKFIAESEQDPELAVIVIAGAGDRGFCGGADIKEARTVGTTVEERRRLKSLAWADAVDQASKPVIAAVHGFCLGGGMELALACDIRIASPDAVMGLPETALGLIPGGGGTQRLPRVIGKGRALDMILTGERVKADEALRIGLVTRLAASRESLLEEALKLAAHIAARPPVASAYAKEAVKKEMEMDLAGGLDLEKTLFSMLMATEDRAEAAQAFAEKRPPRFKGR